ncbi:MAG: proton-conducting transporter membrane subunit [Halobacteriales archaeon]
MTDVVLPLLVACPLVGAAIALVAGRLYRGLDWYVGFVALAVEAGLVVGATRSYLASGRLSHEVGGVPPAYGIELAFDGLSLPVAALVSGVALSVLVYTRYSGPRGPAFHSAYLLLAGGLMGVTVTADAFNLYVFIEITGLAAYALVASRGDGASAYAALKYLVVGTVGASLYLVGVAYVFVATGTLNMAWASERLSEVGYTDPVVVASFCFVVVGLAVKTALYPLHSWQPDAYSAAPVAVAGYVAALVSTVAAYALARVLFTVYTPEFLSAVPLASTAVVYLACVSVVAGATLAVVQTDVRRMLAYSSVSQFGMVIAGFAVANPTAAFGALIHLVGHGVAKGGAFLGVGLMSSDGDVDGLSGLGRTSPGSSAAFTVLLLTLIGVPPTVGFVGKWYMAVGAFQGDRPVVAVVVVVSTLLTLAYAARLIDRMYYGSPATAADGGRRSPAVAVVALAAAVAVALGLLAGEMEAALALEEVLG